MKIFINILMFCSLFCSVALFAQKQITEEVMSQIYEEVKTPYKYGLVVTPSDNKHKTDCPTVFRKNGKWYMSYLVYNGKSGKDGRGYETWLAESEDLLHWTTLGRILSFPKENSGRWDENQRAGYIALIDYQWNGTYEPQKFDGKYWMSYFGGTGQGYEQGMLHEGMAFTAGDITQAHEWQTLDKPVLSPLDKNKEWWENITQYKSSVIWDKKKTLGHPFVLYYNAGGVNPANNVKAERIGIALSDDMLHWKRYSGNPIVNHEQGITGDGVIQKIGDLYVMFYFGAFHKSRTYKAFNTFACSSDLVHWTDWTGEDLIIPSEKYDNLFAHKSCVIKWNNVVYHFYCAVNENDQRGIAVATSKSMGKSLLRFPKPDKETFRTEISLNEDWRTSLEILDTKAQSHEDTKGLNFSSRLRDFAPSCLLKTNIPHNWDKYEGARRLKHGNLHGTALYKKTFHIENQGKNKRYFLFFEGVGSYAEVFVNGKKAGEHAGGRTTFTLDVTDFLNFTNENELLVSAKHPPMIADLPWVCGGCSSEWGFSEGSQPMGIFRPVTLVVTEDVRIEPFGVYAYTQTPEFQENDTIFTLNTQTEIKNYSTKERRFEIIQKLTDKDGRQIERITDTITLKANEIHTVFQKSKPLKNPYLWNPENPYLYKLVTMLKENGRVIDQETTNYGFRWISFPLSRNDSDKRFYLNGKPLFINGTCEYEHILGGSHAFSEEQILARMKQIETAGFNAFREAHQPHNLRYQDYADRHGMLYWAQFSAHIWYDAPEFRRNFKTLIRQWIKERRNSPSVILWGLQNESVLPEDFARECTEIIREMDLTSPAQRLVTTCNGGIGADWNVIQNWSGTYGGDLENYGNELKLDNQLLNGEYGAWRSAGLHSEDSTAKNSEENFRRILGAKIRLAEQVKDSVIGQFQWIYASHDNPGRVQNDEGSRPQDKIGPFNYKGLVTIWDEPTSGYYLYKEYYNPVIAGDNPQSRLIRDIPASEGNDKKGLNYIYQVNCGGSDYIDKNGNLWLADVPKQEGNYWGSISWTDKWPYLAWNAASQGETNDSVTGISDPELFHTFRYGRDKLKYIFPLPDGEYTVELYFAETWWGREGVDAEGFRIFDVAIGGDTVLKNMDIFKEAGFNSALKKTVKGKSKNGILEISFPQVLAGQATISAIAISSDKKGIKPAPSSAAVREILPFPEETESVPAITYKEFETDSVTNTYTFTIRPGVASVYALRFKYQNTSQAMIKARIQILASDGRTMRDDTIQFPATPNKWRIINTTTGVQINAGEYKVIISSENINYLKFESLDVQ